MGIHEIGQQPTSVLGDPVNAFIQKAFSEHLLPEIVPVVWEISMNETDASGCPRGAYVLVRSRM